MNGDEINEPVDDKKLTEEEKTKRLFFNQAKDIKSISKWVSFWSWAVIVIVALYLIMLLLDAFRYNP